MPFAPSRIQWSDPDKQPLLTTRQAAEVLGVDRTYVHLLVERGYLPPPHMREYKTQKFMLHSREVIEQYKQTHPRVGRNTIMTASSQI